MEFSYIGRSQLKTSDVNKKRDLPPRTHVALPMMTCDGAARQQESSGIALLNRYAILEVWYEEVMGKKEETAPFKAHLLM